VKLQIQSDHPALLEHSTSNKDTQRHTIFRTLPPVRGWLGPKARQINGDFL
jgi:hypothetical protein